MKEKNSFLKRYLFQAPVFLAMERAVECRLIAGVDLRRPILDLGCGDGLFSSVLFNMPPEIGIDISQAELMKASQRKAYRNIVSGDLSMLPLKTQSFNTVICNSVMEHVIDLKKAIKEARRVLSPQGKFILTLPTENYEKFLFYPRILNGLGLKALARYYRKAVTNIFKHYHAYPATHWIKIIEDNGFQVIKTIEYCPKKVMKLSAFHLPFSSISFINKKIFKRWILCPGLRKHIAGSLELYLRKTSFYYDASKGARIFIEATRL